MLSREVAAMLGAVILAGGFVGAQYVDLSGFNDLLTGRSDIPSGNMSDPVVQKCHEYAAAIEANASFASLDPTCDCIPPGSFDASRYSAGEQVDASTELFLVQCTLPSGESETYPFRMVTDGTGVNVTDAN